MYLGGGSLAWCSDYAQIYFFDSGHGLIKGLDALDAAVFERGWHADEAGFVIFTQDALHQRINVAIYDSAPEESAIDVLSGDSWTKSVQFTAKFPAQKMFISGPSASNLDSYAPTFALPAVSCMARVSWLEYPNDRYDAFRPKPDVFRVEIWPA
jgi:hypothetical protein